MQHYETVILFSEKLTEEEYNKAVDEYVRFIYSFPTTSVKNTERLGKKALVYEIRENKNAYYAIITYRTFHENIAELQRYMRVDDKVLKFITVHLEDDTEDDEDYLSISDMNKFLSPEVTASKSEQPLIQDAWDMIFEGGE